MSVSTATDRLPSSRRVPPRHMVGALLLASGIIAVLVLILNSSTTSRTVHMSARPAVISATHSHPAAQATSAPVSSVADTTFRDPVTHALLAAGTPATPQAEPGLGHR
jgi:hypothetical protein